MPPSSQGPSAASSTARSASNRRGHSGSYGTTAKDAAYGTLAPDPWGVNRSVLAFGRSKIGGGMRLRTVLATHVLVVAAAIAPVAHAAPQRARILYATDWT